MTLSWSKQYRDKYGRGANDLVDSRGRVQAVIVTLPKAYELTYGTRFLVSVWINPARTDSTRHFAKRSEAKVWAIQEVTRLHTLQESEVSS